MDWLNNKREKLLADKGEGLAVGILAGCVVGYFSTNNNWLIAVAIIMATIVLVMAHKKGVEKQEDEKIGLSKQDKIEYLEELFGCDLITEEALAEQKNKILQNK